MSSKYHNPCSLTGGLGASDQLLNEGGQARGKRWQINKRSFIIKNDTVPFRPEASLISWLKGIYAKSQSHLN